MLELHKVKVKYSSSCFGPHLYASECAEETLYCKPASYAKVVAVAWLKGVCLQMCLIAFGVHLFLCVSQLCAHCVPLNAASCAQRLCAYASACSCACLYVQESTCLHQYAEMVFMCKHRHHSKQTFMSGCRASKGSCPSLCNLGPAVKDLLMQTTLWEGCKVKNLSRFSWAIWDHADLNMHI